jgi:hypothetical protein
MLPEFLKRKSEVVKDRESDAVEAAGVDPIATLVITLDPKTHEMRIVGNVTTNREAVLGMLIGATNMVFNNQPNLDAEGRPIKPN